MRLKQWQQIGHVGHATKARHDSVFGQFAIQDNLLLADAEAFIHTLAVMEFIDVAIAIGFVPFE
jgi:hypothetical protein